jgi:outer membrane protein
MFPGMTYVQIMKKSTLAAAIGVALVSGSVWAQDFQAGDWLVRARVVHLDASNKNSNPAVPVSVNDKALPEVDFTYFFSPNLAAELILTVPQKHNVYLDGVRLGSLKHLPPTLSLQYHFQAKGFKPYVGAGINYTNFSSVSLAGGVDVKRHSWGGALQVGVDVPVSKNMVFNVDVKKVYIKTEVSAGGAFLTTHKIDPLLVGVGLGWKF